ncbi:PolC-type DNA polymerase III [Faecalitalea cylindroides]|uniref:PolC-type DNA polymerase III n=1 Tax=Faecalitalea cylindroides TaxID=39483 RepID=UPI001957717E|nr:PolC-type DNA polymerase III [Faecalitalea cylindroides]MBM6652359.1 PolC-type DNA polymerase III [Faecalitalea cylindroides]
MAQDVTKSFEKLLPSSLTGYFDNATFVKNPVFHSQKKQLELNIEVENVLPFSIYEEVFSKLQLALHVHLVWNLQSRNPQVSMEELDLYVNYFVEKVDVLRCFRFLHPYQENHTVCFSTKDPERLASLNLSLPTLKEELKKVGIEMDILCKLVEDDEDIETNVIEIKPIPQKVAPETKRNNYSYKKEEAEIYKISELQVGMRNVAFEGHIFSIDNRVMKSKKTLQMLYISDYEDAIVAKRFEGARCPLEEIEKAKKGQTVRVTGEVVYDSFSKCDAFMINKMEVIPEKKRVDNAKEKRIEWHVHSNFSEMDGVCAIEEFIQTAYDWGMDAIGICDHQVVQAFPMAQHKVSALNKANPNRNFQMLYGCEMSMVDPEYKIVTNNNHAKLEDCTFVVFDLETTGLSNRLDKIIEFGAVKMKNREVISRKQMFINPECKLPAHIMSLTHITQNDVDSAKTIEEAIDEILEYFEDAVLVAHNGVFDVGFINAALRKLGREELKNPTIDTLPLAYAILDRKGYRLGQVCRSYGVSYDGEGAHRADYDAEVLSQVMCHMMNDLGSEATMDTLCQLQDKPEGFKKNHPNHITVYAKNKEGLKELFELITLSHTQYLAYNGKSGENVVAEPRIIRKELIEKHAHGNLLFGSSCQNGEIFDLAHTRSEQELLDAMDFYDYIEVQPLECYKNMIDRGSIKDVDELKEIIRFILDAAKKKNKMVIATSDAHYVHPHEKRVRDIYINAKAIGNARHPLYFYDRVKRKACKAPDQHLLTTDEMLQAFSWIGEDLAYKIVVENPRELKSMMEPIYPIKDKLYPPDIEGSDQKLRDICFETAHSIYGDNLPDVVEKRLSRELDSIIGHGYYVVYYISHLLVKKSNDDGYLVGSRGSVGSSFVATMSNITEVNPLTPHYVCPKCHYYEFVDDEDVKSGFDLPDKSCPVCGTIIRGDGQDIPFETFLGFEGDKVPDIDLNFSGEYQPTAHAYTKEVFGEDHVFRAGTVGTVQEKTAYGYVKGYEEEMDIPEYSEAKRTDLAKACEGVKRTTGQHPGGIVVVPLDMDVHDFTPVQYPANNPNAEWKTTHFDFHQIHDNILKFDILGHVDPTAMKMLERITGVDVRKIPMNDIETMMIFSSTDSLKIDTTKYNEVTGAAGIPEFGTPFVRGILELTKPTTFGELVTISGLSHGTDVWLGNAKDLIDNGTCVLSEVIGCRDDIMVDLIQYGLEPKLSFTIMESVRKGKGLKDDWIKAMKASNVPDWFIDSCLKIKYMFPKAHAVAYVMMAVRIAWFKVHMPVHYYCMFFSIRCDAYDIQTMIAGEEAIRMRMSDIKRAREDKTQKVSDKENAIYDTLELALEMTLRGFRFSNVSINRSAANEFIVDPDDPKAIIPPFTSLDGLGDNVGKSVVEAREKRPFLSKEDVLKRTQLSKTLCDRLDQMGAMEGLDEENQMTLF